MRSLLRMLLLLCAIYNVTCAAAPNYIHYDSLTTKEFRALAASLPELPGTIQAMLIFRGAGQEGASVAFSTNDEKSGWQIFVFTPDQKGHYQLSWKSGKLNDSFQVAGASDLSLFDFGSNDGIVFHGCARHVCPDVFSVLLYVPKKHTSFMETYIWGKISYSFNIKASENQRYKSILDQLVKDHTPME